MSNSHISTFEYINVFIRWKKFIIRNTLVVALVALILSFVIPKWYQASATLMPPRSGDDLFGLSAVLSDLPDIGGLGLGGIGSSSADTYIAILQSRSVQDTLIEKFDLMHVYDQKLMVLTRKELKTHLNFNLNDDGTISISAEAKTPYLSFGDRDNAAKILAKEMTDYLLIMLDRVNKRLRSENAANNRLFIEKRYDKNLHDLAKAEIALKKFQQKNNAISLPDQVKATIETMAALRSEIISKQIEINVLRNVMNSSHSILLKNQKELKELEIKLAELAAGRGSGNSKDVLLSFSDLPKLSLEYAKVYRELLIQQKIQEFLLPQYEQAKIQEAKDTPTIQVLDPPILPEYKSRPKRALFILFLIAANLLITFIAGYIVANLEYTHKSNPQKYSQFKDAAEALRLKNLFR